MNRAQNIFGIGFIVLVDCAGQNSPPTSPAGTGVFDRQTGNPFIPGYTADGSIFFDDARQAFYLYGTNDGNFYPNVWPTQVWYSKDFKDWRHQENKLPAKWFKSPNRPGESEVWAPSIFRYPKNGKYYIAYSIHGQTFVAVADSPVGPWQDANLQAPDTPLLCETNLCGEKEV